MKKSYRYVLYVILIAAVVFFAVVYTKSYYATSASRGEDRGLDSVISYSNSVKRAATNIYRNKKVLIDDKLPNKPVLKFNAPDQFQYLTDASIAVFHPDGGRGKYKAIHSSNMENGKDGHFVYNDNYIIDGYVDDSKPEIMGFLVGITKEKCRRINKIVGLPKIYRLKSSQSELYNQNNLIEGVPAQYLGLPQRLDHPKLHAQGAGCFQSYDKKEYVYYTRIMPR